MTIQTETGLEIFVLPDCARCKAAGKNPTELDKCPIYNFDDDGECCVPELCEEYEE